jgi:hypothetical protein
LGWAAAIIPIYYQLIGRSGDQPTVGSMRSGVQITQFGVEIT